MTVDTFIERTLKTPLAQTIVVVLAIAVSVWAALVPLRDYALSREGFLTREAGRGIINYLNDLRVRVTFLADLVSHDEALVDAAVVLLSSEDDHQIRKATQAITGFAKRSGIDFAEIYAPDGRVVFAGAEGRFGRVLQNTLTDATSQFSRPSGILSVDGQVLVAASNILSRDGDAVGKIVVGYRINEGVRRTLSERFGHDVQLVFDDPGTSASASDPVNVSISPDGITGTIRLTEDLTTGTSAGRFVATIAISKSLDQFSSSMDAVLQRVLRYVVPCAFAAIVLILLVHRLMRRLANEVEARRIESRTAKAIAQTTQMLAHDIRRPFTKIRSGLAMLEHVEDPAEMQATVARIARVVESDIESVNHMVADILVAGNEVALELTEVDLRELLLKSLGDICTLHPAKDVNIDIAFESSRLVHADAAKLARVTANILDNALQAMPAAGVVWIKTRTIGTGPSTKVEARLGNSGSVIAEADLRHIFKPFFTKGKKNGTGLGLAIVQRIVEAHGGTITCSSSEAMGTEFVFSVLAGAGDGAALTTTIPTSSAEARTAKNAGPVGQNVPDSQLDRDREVAIESKVRNASRALGRPLCVLVIDDEDLYTEALKARLASGKRLRDAVEIVGVTTPDDAFAALRARRADLVVCDIDLGDAQVNGIDLVAAIRRSGFVGKICVHSNRIDRRAYQDALAAGADAFLPKPMRRLHLLSLLASAVAKVQPGQGRGGLAPKRPTVAVVEDDVFMLEAWESALSCDADVVPFTSPAAFWKAIDEEPRLLGELSCVVTDYHFGDNDDDGGIFAAAVRSRSPSMYIVLSSNSDLVVGARGSVDRIVGKTPLTWADLHAARGGQS